MVDGFKNLSSKRKGILLITASSFLFCAMQISIRFATGHIPLMQQIFFRNIITLIISFIFIKRDGASYFGGKSHQPLLFVRSGFGFLGLIAAFYASGHALQADVSTIIRLSPFMITILARIILKEKISKIQIPALLIAFSGALFIVSPSFKSRILPLAAAFACAFSSSIAYTLLAYFKDKVNGMTIIMHFSCFCMVGSIPFMINNFVIPNAFDATMLLLIGVLGGFGQIALTYAYRQQNAGEISVYSYFSIIFSIVLGFIFLGESLPATSILGSSLILLAAYLVYKFSHK